MAERSAALGSTGADEAEFALLGIDGASVSEGAEHDAATELDVMTPSWYCLRTNSSSSVNTRPPASAWVESAVVAVADADESATLISPCGSAGGSSLVADEAALPSVGGPSDDGDDESSLLAVSEAS